MSIRSSDPTTTARSSAPVVLCERAPLRRVQNRRHTPLLLGAACFVNTPAGAYGGGHDMNAKPNHIRLRRAALVGAALHGALATASVVYARTAAILVINVNPGAGGGRGGGGGGGGPGGGGAGARDGQ